MCGIAGSQNKEVLEALVNGMEHRGRSSRTRDELGHVLHPVVGHVKQPIEAEGKLTANCEIYNWKQLAEEHGLDVENDAELLLKLLDRKGLEVLEELDGVYAFAYQKDGQIILVRDLLGVKPVWYSEEPFTFASEKQSLEKQDLEARELYPRQILKYDTETGELSFEQREFFEIDASKNSSSSSENQKTEMSSDEEKEIDEAAEEIKEKFLEAVEKRVPEGDLGLLFSGGVDSTLIAAALQELGKDFTCYTAGIQHGNVNAPRDMDWAEKVADQMDLDLEAYEASLGEVENVLPELADWISTTSTVKLGVALPFHFALTGDEQVVMSGLGSEQLYAGYHRQQGYLNKECLSGLRGLFERDLYRDDVVSMRNNHELRVPFLDHDLVEHALTIPEDYKVGEDYRKYVLRKAAEKLGVPEEVAWRGKTAAQYGSNFDKAISRLAKDNGFDHKQEYLNSFRDRPNNKLAALTSGGKDSNAALYRVQRRNNEISCLVTLRSENKYSYMFDSKKERSEIEKQAEKLGIPLIIQETKGQKEKELEDLEKGLEKARRQHGVEGVVAGALASTYQRDRVEKICEKLGLKVFAPLWQEDQERYMLWLIREGFGVEITDVAARGLNEEWKGRVLDEESVDELIELSREHGFNAAGEGGEYETKVNGFPDKLVD